MKIGVYFLYRIILKILEQFFPQTEGIWKLVACMFHTQPATTVTPHKIFWNKTQRTEVENRTSYRPAQKKPKKKTEHRERL